MINIPVKDYAFVYFNFMLLVFLVLYMNLQRTQFGDRQTLKSGSTVMMVVFAIITLYIGLRPITYSYFGDMGMYNVYFENYVAGAPLQSKSDMGFELFMYGCSKIMNNQMFFLTCAFLYIYPMYRVSKKFFEEYWFYSFFMLVTAFSFWGFATNGIRNGLATSIFLLGLTQKNTYWRIGLLFLAVTFHRSLIIPFTVFIGTSFYTDTRKYLMLWFLMIPLSAAMGGFWESFFTSFGFGEDERLEGYLTDIGKYDDKFSRTGFRWDFILYSASGVLAGWYFVIKKKFEDSLYIQMFNVYLVTNAFWILVIRANYSNRFAYLSWFMIALIIMYPYLKMQFFVNQQKKVAAIVLASFAFSYLMNTILR